MNIDKKDIKIAIVGQPNCGKSTIFKLLTNCITKIRNYPETTSEKIIGINNTYNSKYTLTFYDLPGIYSTKSSSPNKEITIDEIIEKKPDLILCIIDPVTIYRGLNLAIQIMETGMNLILCINMMDEVKNKKVKINFNNLSNCLGIDVVGIDIKKKTAKNKLLNIIISNYKYKTHEQNKYYKISYGKEINDVIKKMNDVIDKNEEIINKYNTRWLAIKYIENDKYIISKVQNIDKKLSDKVTKITEELSDKVTKEKNTSLENLVYDYKHKAVETILKDNITETYKKLTRTISEKIDKILIQGFMGPITILGTIYIMFLLTFNIGYYPKILIQKIFSQLIYLVPYITSNETIQSLLISGLISGVGSVISFIPLIFIIFFILNFLEDLGYMSRMVFVLDKISRFFGLHGSSIIPYVISGGIPGGCVIPGIMSAGIIRNRQERIATILTSPFMICGAKITICLMIIEIFFPNNSTTAMFLLILFSWVMVLTIAKLLRLTILKGGSSYLIMELPPYRLPNLYILFFRSINKVWAFIKRVGIVIIIGSIIIWITMTFPQLPKEYYNNYYRKHNITDITKIDKIHMKFLKTEALKNSIAGRIGTILEPVGKLAGFPWQLSISLISGIAAKEIVISTLSTAYSIEEENSIINIDENDTDRISNIKNKIISDKNSWNTITAISLLIFMLLYAPCTSSILIIARESSWKFAIYSFILSTLFAYAISVLIYQIGSIFT